MKSLPIPIEQQIEAMLGGSIYELIKDYSSPSPETTAFRKFLTLNRRDLIEYLTSNPSIAQTYFQQRSTSTVTHDVERIFQEGNEYVVASMFRGEKRFVRRFHNLAEAVAEVVLLSHGMY